MNSWQQTARYRRASKSTEEKPYHHDRSSGDHAGDGDCRFVVAIARPDGRDGLGRAYRPRYAGGGASEDRIPSGAEIARWVISFAGSSPAQSATGTLD